jgi:uncharacterized protein YndB with AHSA1/START domain
MTETLEHTFTLTRILDAPRETVFQAWTDPEHLQWFFGDAKGDGEIVEVDLRVGGVWRQRMVENETKSYFTGGIYREIVPVERLVFLWGASDGWPSYDADHPEESPLVTVTLNDLGDRTEMVFLVTFPGHLSQDELRAWFALGIRDGWSQTLYRLLISFRLPKVR